MRSRDSSLSSRKTWTASRMARSEPLGWLVVAEVGVSSCLPFLLAMLNSQCPEKGVAKG